MDKLSPMLCTKSVQIPTGSHWRYELKLDGYRALAMKQGGDVRLISRNRNDLSLRFPEITKGLGKLKGEFILDGEIVGHDARGNPAFESLHQDESARLAFYAFDLLELNGKNYLPEPLEKRKAALRRFLRRPAPPVILCDFIEGEAQDIWAAVLKGSFEGLIAKDIRSSYQPGQRAAAWVKIKALNRDEWVIGGLASHPQMEQIGALFLGAFSGATLRYVGKVGTGWTQAEAQRLWQTLLPDEIPKSPFAPQDLARVNFARRSGASRLREIHWLRPKNVCQVEFTERTSDGALRHPVYLGMRDDKPARQVRW